MNQTSDKGVQEANRLAGTRLEILLFRLGYRQLFGINVFKVMEIIPYQRLTKIFGAAPVIKGIATLRGTTMPIIDLSEAIGGQPMENPADGKIIITEYNRSTHGFLVRQVDRIVHTDWSNVRPRPGGTGKDNFVTAVTEIDGKLIEILDVEKVLDQVVPANTQVSDSLTQQAGSGLHRIFVVDDSMVARRQITDALVQLDMECDTAQDGKKAIDHLLELQAQGVDVEKYYRMVISDIEMPEMDGYMLTQAIRRTPGLSNLYILLHSSISGVFNQDLVKATGANKFIQKYSADDLAKTVLELSGSKN
jgi:two-component system chemotaxis response regulator CheV